MIRRPEQQPNPSISDKVAASFERASSDQNGNLETTINEMANRAVELDRSREYSPVIGKIESALSDWQNLNGVKEGKLVVPRSVDELALCSKDFGDRLDRLVDAERLIETNFPGVDTQAILIPWRFIREECLPDDMHCYRLQTMMDSSRHLNGSWHFNSDQNRCYQSIQVPGNHTSMIEYTEDQITNNGDWGVGLVSTNLVPDLFNNRVVNQEPSVPKGAPLTNIDGFSLNRIGYLEAVSEFVQNNGHFPTNQFDLSMNAMAYSQPDGPTYSYRFRVETSRTGRAGYVVVTCNADEQYDEYARKATRILAQ